VTFSALANTKTRPLLSAVRRPQKTFSVKASVASGHGDRAWARIEGCGRWGPPKPKAAREPSRATFGTNCRSCSGSAHHEIVPLVAYC
jgi:hypothetical protein